MDETVLILRMLERIIAVLIGGVAIYLGYRLFFHLPFERNHEGKLELPGVKIVLSRVGPGIFFAAFGSVILYYSLTTVIQVDGTSAGGEETGSRFTGAGPGITRQSREASNEQDSRPQDLSKALTSIEILNCAERLIRDDPTAADLQDQIGLSVRAAKIALLLSVWKRDEWGPPGAFRITGPASSAPFELRSAFAATYPGCPR